MTSSKNNNKIKSNRTHRVRDGEKKKFSSKYNEYAKIETGFNSGIDLEKQRIKYR